MIFILKKLIGIIITLWLVSISVFLLFQVIDNNPIVQKMGIIGADNKTAIEQMEKEFNLDKQPIERYKIWVGGVLKGDLGQSIIYQSFDVNQLILQRIFVTISIAGLSIFFSILIAIPLTIYISINRKSKVSIAIKYFSLLGISLPNFWVSIILIEIFAVFLNLVSITTGNLILPIVALTIPNASLIIKYLYSSMSIEVKKDYVTYLKTLGLTDMEIILKHVLKNSLISVITVLGMIFMSVLTGSVIIENVFSLNGLGRLMVSAINGNDYMLVQGLVLYYALIVVLVTNLIDIAYFIVDKRIKN